MPLEEAIEWLEGKRSMVNMVPVADNATWNVRIAQANAAMMQMAYCVWMYHKSKETT